MSKLTIDELEILTPDQLGELLILEVQKPSQDFLYIQDLLDVGCPINSIDHIGRTAFYCSAIDRKFKVFKFLLSKGADIMVRDNMGLTVWDWLARLGILEVIEFLISLVDVNYSGRDGFTALHWAARDGHLELVKFLILNGADINAKNVFDQTPWDVVHWKIREALPELEPK